MMESHLHGNQMQMLLLAMHATASSSFTGEDTIAGLFPTFSCQPKCVPPNLHLQIYIYEGDIVLETRGCFALIIKQVPQGEAWESEKDTWTRCWELSNCPQTLSNFMSI